jgi:CRISPR-associated protein Cas2
MYEIRFMRLIVFFDLPTATKKDRKAYSKFRKFLIDNGFMMIQFSVYVRICKGLDTVQMYEVYLEKNIPPKGNVRTLTITNAQYERIKVLLGTEKYEEKIGERQLVLF